MTPTQTVESAPVVYHGQPLPLSVEARKRFSEETATLLASKIGLSAGVSAVPSTLLYATLELAARYDLDPFANEIWVAKMGGRDGGGGQLAIMVGVAGYAKVAGRDRAFVSCAGQAVYTEDELEVELDETGGLSHFRFKAAHPARRGEPVGAFAILRRRGDYAPLYFFAPLAQFKKAGGAWKYEDAMIVKCARSYLLRTTYNVSGAVPFDEISVGFDPQARADAEGTAVEEQVVALPPKLEAMLARAEALDPHSWRRNEVEARVLDAAGDVLPDAARRVERDLVEWLTENDADYDPRGSFAQDAPVDAGPGEPVDAEVVDLPDVGGAAGASGAEQAGDEGQGHPADADAQNASDSPAEPPEGFMLSPGACAAKWVTEPESDWRRDVERAIAARDALEERRRDATDEDEDRAIGAELDVLDEALAKRGVPRGWEPPKPGQDALL